MRIFLLTLGTRGDFELFLTLGCQLHGRGHQVILGTSGFYTARVQEAQLESVKIGEGTQEQLRLILQSLSSVSDKTKRTYLYYKNWLQPQLAKVS